MSKLAKALTAAAGNAAGESLYVEDVFSTYLYAGTGTDQTITNGINLSEEGGLVWLKNRGPNYTGSNTLYDTERGGDYRLETNSTAASGDVSVLGAGVTFNTDGFVVKGNYNNTNRSGDNAASWTFRKAEKFFDVVTYTGNGTTQEISHNLGVAPAFIIVKETSTTRDWVCYHSALGETYRIFLNGTNAATNSSSANVWGNNTTAVAPTDSVFTVGNTPVVNESGGTYVAYLFASDAGGYGDDGSESIIKCGSYVGTGASGNTVDFGFEPQWVLIKNTQVGTKSWHISDMMRGLNYSTDHTLSPNTSSAEANWAVVKPTATGLLFTDGDDNFNSAHTFIYIAIRRPMKTPESGTEVFGVRSYTETTDYQQLTTGNLADWGWQFLNGDGFKFFTRLIGKGYLTPSSDAAANTSATTEWDYMDGFAPYYANGVSGFSPRQVLGFTRASGFFDVVAWIGDGTSNRDINHNLGVTPELIIVKSRTNTDNWFVYLGSPFGSFEGDYMLFNSNGIPSSTNISNIFPSSPTSTTFRVGNERGLNGSGEKIVAYLLASVDGVSKIGTYSGSSSNVDVTLGFAPRLFIVKKLDTGTSGNAHWIMWNSALGIVAGNDPRIRISSGAYYASNDCIDPITNGIRVLGGVNGNFNEAGSEYSYIAIA